jgi:hypothetical protein
VEPQRRVSVPKPVRNITEVFAYILFLLAMLVDVMFLASMLFLAVEWFGVIPFTYRDVVSWIMVLGLVTAVFYGDFLWRAWQIHTRRRWTVVLIAVVCLFIMMILSHYGYFEISLGS